MAKKIDDKFYKLDDKKRKMVEDNYGFIIWVTNRWWNTVYKNLIEYDDMLQMCTLSFIKSLRTYDENKGKLTNWAYMWISKELNNWFNSYNTKQHLNETSVDILYEIEDKEYLFIDDINDYEEIINQCVIEQLLSKTDSMFNLKALSMLKLYLFNDLTQAEIAKKFNVSREYVRQIISKFHNLASNYISKEELIA